MASVGPRVNKPAYYIAMFIALYNSKHWFSEFVGFEHEPTPTIVCPIKTTMGEGRSNNSERKIWYTARLKQTGWAGYRRSRRRRMPFR